MASLSDGMIDPATQQAFRLRRFDTTMLRVAAKSLLARKLRFALTLVAILLGVSMTVASFVLADSLRSTFNKLVGDIESGIDLTARTKLEFGESFDRRPIDEKYLAPISKVPGVAAASGRMFIPGTVPVKPDGTVVKTIGPPIAGINYATDEALSQLIQIDGRKPSGPAEFNLDVDTARNEGFIVGNKYTVIGAAGRREFTLVGTVAFNSVNNDTVGAVISVFDTPTAQDFLGRKGSFDEIAIKLASGADQAAVASAAQALLPADSEVVDRAIKIEEGEEDFGQISAIFGTVLLVFAVIMVFVAAFIINNTFQIVLGQRVRELALIRTLGATSKQVRRSVLLEALLFGVIATIVGLVLGLLTAIGLRGLINSAGGALPGGPISLKPRTIIAAAIVGIGVTMLAAIAPARRVRKLSPMAALRDDARLGDSGLRRRIIVGTTVVVFGLVLLALGTFAGLATAGLLTCLALGALTVFIGVNLLSPLFARPVARSLGRSGFGWVFVALGGLLAIGAVALAIIGIIGVADGKPASLALTIILAPIVAGLAKISFDGGRAARGLTGQLARENAARNPRRTASTAAALMIGLALVSMAAVVGESLRKSFISTLDNTVEADWFVRDVAANRDPTAALPPEYTQRVRALPQVESALAYRFTFDGIKVGETAKDINATDYPDLPKHLNLDVVKGDIATAPTDAILVHKDSAKDNNLDVGSKVEVSFADGQTESLTVAAIYKDATLLGNWVISNTMWDKHFARQTDQFITVKLKPDADPAAAKAAIEALKIEYPQANAEDRATFKKSQEDTIAGFLRVLQVFLGLSVVIAFIGIVNTMSLSVFERTREIGLLRAVGTTRRQLADIVRWEACIVALLGGLLGVVLGVVFGLAAVAAIPNSVIKTVSIPVPALITYVVMAGLAGLVAAWFPARRAANLNVLDAVSHT